MEKLEKCKEFNGVSVCKTEDDEIVVFGSPYGILPFTDADTMQSSNDGFALGYRDEKGRIWFGGCDPSNFLNNVSEEYEYPDGKEYWDEITEKTPEIRRWIKEGDCYLWRPGYEAKSIFQLLSRRVNPKKYKILREVIE